MANNDKSGVVVLSGPDKKKRFNPDLKNTMSSVVGGAGEASLPNSAPTPTGGVAAAGGAGAVMASVENPSKLFYTFMESIADESNIDKLIPIVEGYSIIYGVENNVLTEASFNDFARKHGGKVKAFMAGLMLLASVASAGNSHGKVNVDDGHNPYGGKAQTQMSSGGHDGTAEGTADAQKLLQLLKNDKVDNNELHKHFDSMKSHAKDPGYMGAMSKVMNGAGIDVSKIFGSDAHSDSNNSHDTQGDVKKLANDMKQTESDDEQVALSQGHDILKASGVTGYDVGVKQLPNGNYVAVASPMTASK